MTKNKDFGNISKESREILTSFGAEAPTKLNAYACKLEDVLLDALAAKDDIQEQLDLAHRYIEKVQSVLQEAKNERERMLNILSNPEALIDYITEFFGPQGPCPGSVVISSCESHSKDS